MKKSIILSLAVAATAFAADHQFPEPGSFVTMASAEATDNDLGRLEQSTTITPVLIRAELEARAVFTPDMAAFYNLDFPALLKALGGSEESAHYLKTPLQNLALFRDLMIDGKTNLNGVDQKPDVLFAVFLGVAADQPITRQTVDAVVENLAKGLTEPIAVDPDALVSDAEKVRLAVQRAGE